MTGKRSEIRVFLVDHFARSDFFVFLHFSSFCLDNGFVQLFMPFADIVK
jgi:hypothetical protein